MASDSAQSLDRTASETGNSDLLERVLGDTSKRLGLDQNQNQKLPSKAEPVDPKLPEAQRNPEPPRRPSPWGEQTTRQESPVKSLPPPGLPGIEIQVPKEKPAERPSQGWPAPRKDGSIPLPPFKIPTPNDRTAPQPPGNDKLPPFRIDTGPRDTSTPVVRELYRLNNRAGDHQTPDAVVRIPGTFDPSKPINVVIYNHGWGSDTQSAYRDNNLSDQMTGAPPNTILIVPEWQRVAGASNGDQGNFGRNGVFRAMLQEILDKTPELRGKTINDIAGISIFSHSAGYGPTETILYNNGLGDKVKSLTLLDSLYDSEGFDPWIKANIRELAAGTKQFHSIFFGFRTRKNSSGDDNLTSVYSKRLAGRVADMLRQAGLPQSGMYVDYNNKSGGVLDPTTFANYSIVFKDSSITAPGKTPHFVIPSVWIAPVEQGQAMRNKVPAARRP